MAQNGAKIVKNTPIILTGCGVCIVRHRVKGKRVVLTLEVPFAGRVSISGYGLRGTARRVRKHIHDHSECAPQPGWGCGGQRRG